LSTSKKVDPCGDFYEYACGEWLSQNRMPANVYTYSVVTKIGEANTRILYEALTRPLPKEDYRRLDFAGVNKARAFYASCQNQRILNQKGTGPLLMDIDEVGGWAALDNWDNATFDLNDMTPFFKD